MSERPECAGRGWHYDDMSCCHVLIEREDVAHIAAAIDSARRVLDQIERGRYVAAQRTTLTLAELEGAASLLPDVSDSETVERIRCRVPGCSGTYYPKHEVGETGWRFAEDEPEGVPAHDHYGSAL